MSAVQINGELRHILINSERMTADYVNRIASGNFTQKRLINVLTTWNQKTVDLTVHRKMIQKVLKAIYKANYEIISSVENKDYPNDLDLVIRKKGQV